MDALFARQCDAAKALVHGVIVVETEGVLVDGFQLAAKCGECFGWDGVAVDGGFDVGTGFVDGAVDAEAGRVDGVHVAAFDDFAVLVHQAEVAGFHVLEGFGEGVDPEVVYQNGVADRDVPAGAFVVVAV